MACAIRDDNWGLIVAHQFVTTFSAFDVGQERGPFYPTGQPILPLPWAALWVLGTAYMVWRVGDVRYAMLACWMLGGLAGAAFTNDTPTLQRAVTVIPLLALLPAIFLDRLATGAWGEMRNAKRETRNAVLGHGSRFAFAFAFRWEAFEPG